MNLPRVSLNEPQQSTNIKVFARNQKQKHQTNPGLQNFALVSGHKLRERATNQSPLGR